MNQHDLNKIQVALCGLYEVLDRSGRPLTVERQKGYAMALLSELSVDQIGQACQAAMVKCKWFPVPSELIGMVTTSIESNAIEAWRLVMIHVTGANVHSRSEIDLGDPIANAAVRAIGGVGYVALQGTTSEHEKFTRPRFIEAYKRLSVSGNASGSRFAALVCRGKREPLPIGGPKETQKKRLTERPVSH